MKNHLNKINDFLFTELYIIPLLILAASFNSFPLLNSFYLLFPVLGLLFIIIKRVELITLLRKEKFVLLFYLFPLWASLTALWSLEPETSIIRALYLSFIITAALLAGSLWFKKKENLNFLIPVNVFVVIVSVISLVFGVPEASWELNPIWRFKGFAAHQNTLGALILFASLPLIWNLFLKRIELFHIFLLLINVGVLTITFSRASILSFLLIIVVLTIRLKFTLFLKIFATSIVLVGVILLIKPQLVIQPLNHIVFKGSNSVYSTREKLFEDSFQAAKDGSLLGLGYGISDPKIEDPIYVGKSDHIREKGNSILALIEETGMIGLLLFFFPIVLIIKRCSLRELFYNKKLFLLLTLYSSLLLHSQFEAWLVGVSSFQLLISFTLVISFNQFLLVRPFSGGSVKSVGQHLSSRSIF